MTMRTNSRPSGIDVSTIPLIRPAMSSAEVAAIVALLEEAGFAEIGEFEPAPDGTLRPRQR